uniref:Si:dkey-245n4.2 n=1 Tax=Hippocampus comes TaxID=109280 RepID=A0A3Q2ZM84_HIPCM
SGLNIRNKLLGTCLQVHDGSPGVRVSLGQCDPHSAFQKWLWLPESQSLRNQYTGECLTAPEEQFEGVHLQPCHLQNEEAGGQLAPASKMGGDAGSQQWSCSKKGHLTLLGKGLHLSATQESTLVFVSRMSWKITMLVLSSLALVLGTVILIFNVYSNRKKVVCVLKSYTPKPEAGIPGSPVPCERAPLTEHAMRYPLSSPTMQRGEILIEWKDGTVTPL